MRERSGSLKSVLWEPETHTRSFAYQLKCLSDVALEVTLPTLSNPAKQACLSHLQSWSSQHIPKGEWVLSDGGLCFVTSNFGSAPPDLRDLALQVAARLNGWVPQETLFASSRHCFDLTLGGPQGPDLDEVLKTTGMSSDSLCAMFEQLTLSVQFIGFLPGFAYLTGLPPLLAELPRRKSPRTQVQARTLAMAAGYCAVYPLNSPGGWNLLGEVHADFMDVSRQPPSRLQLGDEVRFKVVRVEPCSK